jgi:hypothetical protein
LILSAEITNIMGRVQCTGGAEALSFSSTTDSEYHLYRHAHLCQGTAVNECRPNAFVSSEGSGYGEQIMAINAYKYKDRTGTQISVQTTNNRGGIIIANMDGQSSRRRNLQL